MSQKYYLDQQGEQYFDFRWKRRSQAAQLESSKIFLPYARQEFVILDFGCGTGDILSYLPCCRRLGVEINEPSIKIAQSKGIEVYRNLDEVSDNIADLIISHHALEHVQDPYNILVKLRAKLKPGCSAVIVVPAESPFSSRFRKFQETDRDKHLYSWTPLTLGNLMNLAGFKVIDSYIIEAGYSHYIEWSKKIKLLFSLLKKLVAFILNRYHIVCVGQMVKS